MELSNGRQTRRLLSEVSGELNASASRRKDRKLLDDITLRLYDVDNDLIKPSDDITTAVTDLRRRVSARDRSAPGHAGVSQRLAGGGGRPRQQQALGSRTAGRAKGNGIVNVRAKRTVSEPYYGGGALLSNRSAAWGAGKLGTAGGGKLPPTAELAVRTARRCLSRLETELGHNNSDDIADFDLPIRNSSLKQQVKSTMPISYLDDLDGLDADDYYVPRAVPSATIRGRTLNRAVIRPLTTAGVSQLLASSSRSRQVIRHRSLTPSRPAVTPVRRQFSTEDDYDFVSPSYSNLRARYTEAKNKLDIHKTLLDKYLPLYLGPENDVEIEVDYKFGELCARMPTLDPFRPPMNTNFNNFSSSSKPPRARPLNNTSTKQSTQPKMSDTRKRVREVICKTRNDKHYYA